MVASKDSTACGLLFGCASGSVDVYQGVQTPRRIQYDVGRERLRPRQRGLVSRIEKVEDRGGFYAEAGGDQEACERERVQGINLLGR
jgi:hypothetical protein